MKMTREDVYEKLNEIFRDVFDDEDITVNDATTADDIEDWDSLEHINLVVAVEKCFGIKFTMGEVTGMKNVGEMADIILGRAALTGNGSREDAVGCLPGAPPAAGRGNILQHFLRHIRNAVRHHQYHIAVGKPRFVNHGMKLIQYADGQGACIQPGYIPLGADDIGVRRTHFGKFHRAGSAVDHG